jgi:hypothetical protein
LLASLPPQENLGTLPLDTRINLPHTNTFLVLSNLLDASGWGLILGGLPPVANADKIRVVTAKITARTMITFPRKVIAPEGPKKVLTPPPKDAPVLAPLPTCNKITAIKKIQTNTWIVKINPIFTPHI